MKEFPNVDYNDAREAIDYIKSNRLDIVEKAKLIQQGKHTPEEKHITSTKQKIANLCFVNPDDLHGKVYVTEDLEKNSNLTARVITIANGINAFPNLPFLFFCFQNMGFLVASLTTVGITGGIFGIGNIFGGAVARNKPGNKIWSRWAFVGLVSLNIIQTAASGIGIELINNRSKLDGMYATTITNEYLAKKEQKVEDLATINDPSYEAIQQKCEAGEAKLNSLSRTNPLWDSFFVKLYGLHDERNKNWEKIPFQQLPICRQVTRIQDENNLKYEKASNDYQFLLTARVDAGSDVQFLKSNALSAYQQHFNDNGEMKSSPMLVGLATQEVYSKLFSSQWTELGLSFFIFGISLITSIASCLMALYHASSEDVQLSYDQELQGKINDYFNNMRKSLMASQKLNAMDENTMEAEIILANPAPIIENLEKTLEVDYDGNSYRHLNS